MHLEQEATYIVHVDWRDPESMVRDDVASVCALAVGDTAVGMALATRHRSHRSMEL